MRREGEGWSLYRGPYPGRPRGGGATGPPVARGGEGGRQAPLPRPWAGPSGRPRGALSPALAEERCVRLNSGHRPYFLEEFPFTLLPGRLSSPSIIEPKVSRNTKLIDPNWL